MLKVQPLAVKICLPLHWTLNVPDAPGVDCGTWTNRHEASCWNGVQKTSWKTKALEPQLSGSICSLMRLHPSVSS